MSTTLGAPAGPTAVPRSPAEVVRHARARPERRHRLVATGLALALVTVVLVRLLLGDFTVSAVDLVRIIGGAEVPGATYLVLEVRLPRALLGVLVGTALGLGGAVFQSALRNPLASPDVLGVTQGAGAAAVAALVAADLTGPPVVAAALAGGLATALLVRAVAGAGRASTSRMVLVGIAAAAALQAVVQYLFTRADVHDAQLALRWLAGSVSGATWPAARLLALSLLGLVPLVVAAARWLPVLELGPDTAAGLGVGPRRRELLLLLAVGLVGVAVAAAGPVAFVAFTAGPLSRALAGGRTTLLGAALTGAVLVVAADHVGQALLPGGNYPAGVVTGALGAPFLLWLLTRHRSPRSTP